MLAGIFPTACMSYPELMLVCDIHAQGRSKIMATVRRLRSLAKRPTVEPRRLVPIQARFAGCRCEYVRLVGVAAHRMGSRMPSLSIQIFSRPSVKKNWAGSLKITPSRVGICQPSQDN
jgi:hypothetical protein